MREDSDQETSDLDIELKTWKKLQKNIKTIGFLDGAGKGKEMSLQEGFNLGFSDGFKFGEYLGLARGIICCESELQLSAKEKSHFDEKTLNKLSEQKCVICSKEKTFEVLHDKELTTEKSEDLLTTQQTHINKIIVTLKTELKSYVEKNKK